MDADDFVIVVVAVRHHLACVMANALEIREKLGNLLSHRMSLDDFEEWFAPYSWNIHKNGDPESQKLAYAIEHQLSQFDEDCDDLRTELARIHSSGARLKLNPVVSVDAPGPRGLTE